MQDTRQVRVAEVRNEAINIISLKLVSADVSHPGLPPAEPGCHIDLLMPQNLRRSYSLFRPTDGSSYEVAVQMEANGRGGSRYVHENVKKGMTLSISSPRNNFPLRENQNGAVLVAGGIGITPLFSMLQQLLEQRKPVHLIYCARSRAHAAFLDELESFSKSADHLSVTLIFEVIDGRPDLTKLLTGKGGEQHYYCCGPSGMLTAFESACRDLGYSNYFTERFGSSEEIVATQNEGYDVELVRSGKTLHVPAKKPLLDVLLDAGVDIAYSCQSGVCGSCETAVLEGDIEHRDSLLSEEERAAGKTMFVCVSGCKSPRLVLDL